MDFKAKRLLQTMFLILVIQPDVTHGHGRLIVPPSRSTMWRYGYVTPENTDDNALFCGGYQVLWDLNQGKCGICGDRFDGPRENEVGGRYATGIIVRNYVQGETISVSVEITTSHLGHFEFRICPYNNPNREVTQDCLDRYLLQQPDGSTHYPITSYSPGIYTVSLVLPPALTCSQCVLQWKYVTGHFWGCDGSGITERCCTGCGRQEHYYGCADVRVISGSVVN